MADARLLSREDLKTLAAERDALCVSIFAPMERAGRNVRTNPTRFKNLLQQAKDELGEAGLRQAEVKKMLGPGYELLEDTLFWEHQDDGLAALASESMFRVFRVPISLEELAVVAHRFHLKPLLPLLSGNNRFFVLALTQDKARLLQCTHYSQQELNVPNMPAGIKEVLRFDDPESQLQAHIESPGGRYPGAIFHGHGVGKDTEQENIRRYCYAVERAVYDVLKGEKEPLVLATVQFVHPMYAEANRYPHLLEEGVRANPDDMDDYGLREAAWKIVEPRFARARGEALDLFGQLHGTGRASSEPEDVLLAAHDGRVAVMLVATGVHVWGQFDPESREVVLRKEPSTGDEDLLDLAAVQTLVNGGAVHPLQQDEMPEGAAVAAVYRY